MEEPSSLLWRLRLLQVLLMAWERLCPQATAGNLEPASILLELV